MDRKTLTHKEYLASDVWKCDKSPINKDVPLQILNNIGAHHWVEVQSIEHFHTGLFYCKYCYDAKRFPSNWSRIWNC